MAMDGTMVTCREFSFLSLPCLKHPLNTLQPHAQSVKFYIDSSPLIILCRSHQSLEPNLPTRRASARKRVGQGKRRGQGCSGDKPCIIIGNHVLLFFLAASDFTHPIIPRFTPTSAEKKQNCFFSPPPCRNIDIPNSNGCYQIGETHFFFCMIIGLVIGMFQMFAVSTAHNRAENFVEQSPLSSFPLLQGRKGPVLPCMFFGREGMGYNSRKARTGLQEIRQRCYAAMPNLISSGTTPNGKACSIRWDPQPTVLQF